MAVARNDPHVDPHRHDRGGNGRGPISAQTGVSIGLLISVVAGGAYVLHQITQVEKLILPRLASIETNIDGIAQSIAGIKGRIGTFVTHQELELYLQARDRPSVERLRDIETRVGRLEELEARVRKLEAK